MAIHPDLPGVTVIIVANNQLLQEFREDDAREEEGTITRYVEATSGSHFAVHIAVDQTFQFQGDSLAFSIAVDGQDIGQPTFIREQVAYRGQVDVFEGETILGTMRPMKFSALDISDTNDDDDDDDNATRVANVGSITVTVRHTFRVGVAPPKTIPMPDPSQGPLSEKMLKGQALSHSFSFAAPVPSNRNKQCFALSCGPGGFAQYAGIFNFRYRSRDALRAMLVVPAPTQPPPHAPARPPVLAPARPPAPAPAPVHHAPAAAIQLLHERNPRTLTRDELEQVVWYYQAHFRPRPRFG